MAILCNNKETAGFSGGNDVATSTLRKTIPLAIVASLAILAFQNCVGPSNDSQSASQAPPGNGNGQGYDGKLYLHDIVDAICPDGTSTDAKIGLKFFAMLLLRENCVDIPGGRPIDGVLSADGYSILYNNEIFYLIGSGSDKALGQRPVAFVEDPTGSAFFVDEQALARVDQARKVGWAKAPVQTAGTSYAFASGALSSPTELAAVGSVAVKPAGAPTRTKALVAFVDTTGAFRVARSYSLGSSSQLARFESAVSDAAGNLYVTGLVDNDPSQHALSPFLLKLASDGSVVWQRTLPPPVLAATDALTTRVALSSAGVLFARLGSVVVSGSTDGVVAWARQLEDTQAGYHSTYLGIAPAADGGLFVTGSQTDAVGPHGNTIYASFIRLSPAGDVSTAVSYDIGNDTNEAFEEIGARPDGSVLIHGHWIGTGGTKTLYRAIMSFKPDLAFDWGFGMLSGVNGYGAMTFGPTVGSGSSAASSVWIADSSGFFHTTDREASTDTCPLCYPKSTVTPYSNGARTSAGPTASGSLLLSPLPEPLSFNDARDAFKFK